MKPQPKIAAAGIGGAVAVVAVWLMTLFGLDVPPEVAVALGAVLSFGAGYLKTQPA